MTVTPRIGAEIAGYRLESLIERGGMAVVYVADHIRLGRKVAFKILALELSEDDRFRERFLRESRQAASISHPNIIPIYDAGEAEGLLYIAMLYVNGVDLKELIRRDSPLDPERALSIVGQVGSALDAAHANGLIHRDVKPGNILVVPRSGPEGMDHVYLSDFGLTKHKDSKSGITSTGQFVGTIDYVAPEQIEGKQVDGRADIYSLGCVFYESLTGGMPFKKDDEVAVLWAHLREPVPLVSERRPGVPAALDAVVAKAMAKSPDERFASCQEFVAAARAALRAPASVAEGVDTAVSRPDRAIGTDQPGDVVGVPESTQLATPPSLPSEQTASQPAPPLRSGASVEAGTAGDRTPLPAPAPSPQPGTLARPAPPARSSRKGLVLAGALSFLVGAAAAGWAVYAINPGGSSETTAGPSQIYSVILKEHLPDPKVCKEVSPAKVGMSPKEVFGIASCSPGSGVSNVTYSLIHSTTTMQSMLLEPAATRKVKVGAPMKYRAAILSVDGLVLGIPAGTCADMLTNPSRAAKGFADFWSPMGLGHQETTNPSHTSADVAQTAGGRTEGWVVCYKDLISNKWIISWSDNETHILSKATGPDPAKLYTYWQNGGGPTFGGGM